MELTAIQISTIKNYINTVLEYDDLKLEVLDHFISDIEELIKIKNFKYEDAFLVVKLKWNKSFKKRVNSFYFSPWFSAPSIIVKHATKIYKPFFFIFIAIYLLPIFAIKFISLSLTSELILITNKIIKILTILSMVTFIFIYLKVIFSKVKSIYTFIIKTQYYFVVFLFISLLSDNYLNYSKIKINMSLTFFFTGLYGTLMILYFYNKHIKAISTKNYKIPN